MQPSEHKRLLPVVEHFHSIQGEATWCGTPMHFIRLAGCNVGRQVARQMPILKTGDKAAQCTTYDHRTFPCDTYFQRGTMTSWEDLYSETNEEHVCITGGEPFMHKDNPALNDFIDACVDASKLVHFETSGTIEWHPTLSWICVSPKEGYIPNMLICADEIKLLVDTAFNVDNLPSEVFKHDNVWIQPINDELLINQHNVELCRMLLRVHPKWRLSIQMHKAINWR